jgi:hypothetical protein
LLQNNHVIIYSNRKCVRLQEVERPSELSKQSRKEKRTKHKGRWKGNPKPDQ